MVRLTKGAFASAAPAAKPAVKAAAKPLSKAAAKPVSGEGARPSAAAGSGTVTTPSTSPVGSSRSITGLPVALLTLALAFVGFSVVRRRVHK